MFISFAVVEDGNYSFDFMNPILVSCSRPTDTFFISLLELFTLRYHLRLLTMKWV